jgi:hypothetical protein
MRAMLIQLIAAGLIDMKYDENMVRFFFIFSNFVNQKIYNTDNF